MLANTYLPFLKPLSPFIIALAKKGLTLTLFLIGTGLSLSVVRSVGLKPFLQGTLLWAAISAVSLWAVISLVR
ncbi:hypothetical protein [Pedobacter hartonius]|uniref:hypothetical protein n=1 Tax=Pedobacter hartonius TaxID=425514 RepID=UPI0029374A40|nr:hypothetical protein [Pedobacter hartonius]